MKKSVWLKVVKSPKPSTPSKFRNAPTEDNIISPVLFNCFASVKIGMYQFLFSTCISYRIQSKKTSYIITMYDVRTYDYFAIGSSLNLRQFDPFHRLRCRSNF